MHEFAEAMKEHTNLPLSWRHSQDVSVVLTYVDPRHGAFPTDRT